MFRPQCGHPQGSALQRDGYIEKSQKFVNQYTDLKYCFNKVWSKICIKIYNTDKIL